MIFFLGMLLEAIITNLWNFLEYAMHLNIRYEKEE